MPPHVKILTSTLFWTGFTKHLTLWYNGIIEREIEYVKLYWSYCL